MILTTTLGTSLAVDPLALQVRGVEPFADTVALALIAEVLERYGLPIKTDDVEIHRGKTDDLGAAFVHAVWAPATSRQVELLGGPRDGERAKLPTPKAAERIRLARRVPPTSGPRIGNSDPEPAGVPSPLVYRRHGINTTTGRWVYIIEKGSA